MLKLHPALAFGLGQTAPAGGGGGYGPELIVNGTFDTDVSGWSGGGGDTTFAWHASGKMSITRSGSGITTAPYQITPTLENGATYELSINSDDPGNSGVYVEGSGGTNVYIPHTSLDTNPYVEQFTMVAAEGVKVMVWGPESGTDEVDNISLRKVL